MSRPPSGKAGTAGSDEQVLYVYPGKGQGPCKAQDTVNKALVAFGAPQLAPEGKGQTHQGRNDAGRREKEDKEGPQGGENKADDPKPLLGVGL